MCKFSSLYFVCPYLYSQPRKLCLGFGERKIITYVRCVNLRASPVSYVTVIRDIRQTPMEVSISWGPPVRIVETRQAGACAALHRAGDWTWTGRTAPFSGEAPLHRAASERRLLKPAGYARTGRDVEHLPTAREKALVPPVMGSSRARRTP